MRISEIKNVMQSVIIQNYENIKKGASKDRLIALYIQGGVGQGKTSAVRSMTTDQLIIDAVQRIFGQKIDKLEFSNLGLAMFDPAELAGWCVPNADQQSMTRLRPEFLPKDGFGILFVDEVAQATLMHHNIFGQLVDERRLGNHYLGDGWIIISAGNRLKDKAGSNKLPSQLRDRFTYLDLEIDLDDLLKYYAENKVDPRISSWLKFDDQYLYEFDVNADSNCTPRSVERASTLMNLGLDSLSLRGVLSGQIGETASGSLIAHMKLYDKLPDFDSLVKDPSNTAIPEDRGVLYALCGSLASKMTMENCSPILTYMQRIPEQEYMAFMLKDAVMRNKTLVTNPAMKAVLGSQGKLKDLLL